MEHITLALSDVGYATVGNLGHIGEAVVNGTEREPIGNDLYGAFGRDFATKDGRRVMVAAITSRQWKSLLDAIGGHEAMRHVEAMLGVDLSDEGQRFEVRDVIAPVVARWVGARGYDEVCAAFDAAGVCWEPYQSFLEMVSDDPRCSTRNPLFEEVDQPGIGRFLMPGSPLEFRRHEREEIRPAPIFGQHTDEILAEVLGLRAPGSERYATRESSRDAPAPPGGAGYRDPRRHGSKSKERTYGSLCAPKAPMILPTWWYSASNVPAIPVGTASSASTASVPPRLSAGRFE